MIRDDTRRQKAGELQPAVAVRRAHHGDLYPLITQPSDTPGPFSFDRGSPFELEAELAKEINRRCEIIDDDPYVIHPFDRHVSNLQGGVHSHNQPRRDLGEAVLCDETSDPQLFAGCSRIRAAQITEHRMGDPVDLNL